MQAECLRSPRPKCQSKFTTTVVLPLVQLRVQVRSSIFYRRRIDSYAVKHPDRIDLSIFLNRDLIYATCCDLSDPG